MTKAPHVQIRPARESDAASLCAAVKAVAAEKIYLATIDGHSLAQTRAFLKHIIDGSLPQMTAVVNGDVVGFCDIIPNAVGGFTHVARLGMGPVCRWPAEGRYQDVKLMALWL